jgi:CIC family chloride channel protein
VAASFNAPIAGALFAHEVIVGHYALCAFAPVVIASIAATMVSRAVYGDFPAFIIPPLESVEWIEFQAFALTGVACGLAAVTLIYGIGFSHRYGDRLAVPAVLRPALAGMFVGLLALELQDTLGVGYEQTDQALRNLYPLATVFALIAAKLLATSLCLGWGFGGGVFSPSLALGALVGVAAGTPATIVGQDLSSGPAAYALVGMGATAAAVLGAQISTTLIIFELTSDYTLTIATMVAVVVAMSVSTHLFGFKSFFLSQLGNAGLMRDGGKDVNGLKGTTVADCLAPSVGTCTPHTTRADARVMLLTCNTDVLYVADGEGVFNGVVSGPDLADSTAGDDSETVDALVDGATPMLLASNTIENAVRDILAAQVDRLPVVDNAESRRLIGTVAAQDLLRAVNLALLDSNGEIQGKVADDR